MSVRSKAKQHNFQSGGKRGRDGAKLSQRRRDRLDGKRADRVIVDDAHDRLDRYSDAVLFATGHLPEDF